MITTQTAGIANTADPKPTVQLDYAGQPMRNPDHFYNGRPEHQNPDSATIDSTGATSPLRLSPAQKRSRSWTAQRRAEFGQRMRNYWLQRKASQNQPNP